MTRVTVSETKSNPVSRGAWAGIIATIVYTVYAEAVTVAMNGMSAFFDPFRQIGAIALGEQALSPTYDLLTATMAGTVVHFGIGIAFGVAFAVLRTAFGLRSTGASILAGIVFGLAMYAFAVLTVFPALFPWFLANDRVVQSIGHAIFGGVLGWWLGPTLIMI